MQIVMFDWINDIIVNRFFATHEYDMQKQKWKQYDNWTLNDEHELWNMEFIPNWNLSEHKTGREKERERWKEYV